MRRTQTRCTARLNYVLIRLLACISTYIHTMNNWCLIFGIFLVLLNGASAKCDCDTGRSLLVCRKSFNSRAIQACPNVTHATFGYLRRNFCRQPGASQIFEMLPNLRSIAVPRDSCRGGCLCLPLGRKITVTGCPLPYWYFPSFFVLAFNFYFWTALQFHGSARRATANYNCQYNCYFHETVLPLI